MWRDGSSLVVRRGYTIKASRCVLCGTRATTSAPLARATFSLQVPLCARHLSRHRRARLLGWVLGLVGLGVLWGGVLLGLVPLALLGLYAALGGVAYAAVARHLLTLESASLHFLRLSGADQRCLDSLRAWGDYPEPRA